MDVKAGGVQDRILRLLGERYPVTEAEIAIMLSLRPDVVRLEVKRLAARGLVVVEALGAKRFVALSGAGFRVIGLAPSEAAERRKSAKLPPPPPRPEDDPAFT